MLFGGWTRLRFENEDLKERNLFGPGGGKVNFFSLTTWPSNNRSNCGVSFFGYEPLQVQFGPGRDKMTGPSALHLLDDFLECNLVG